MNTNKEYQFKALTISRLIILMLILGIIFFSIVIFMDKTFFYNQKGGNVFTAIKIVGLPMIISFGILQIVSQFVVCAKFRLVFHTNEIIVFKNNKIIHKIPVEEINQVILSYSNKPVSAGLSIKSNNFKLAIFNGFFFSYHKESHLLKKIIKEYFLEYLKNQKNLGLETKETSVKTEYIFSKK